MEDKTSFVTSILASLFIIGVSCSGSRFDEIRDNPSLIENAFTIADLDERIQGLKVKLDKAKLAARSFVQTYSDIKFRVKKLEGTVCSEHEFECGDDKFQCVSELLACDGVKDCRNGRDEDTEFCETSGYRVSTVYTGVAPMSPCFVTTRKSFFHTNVITSIKRSKIFPSRLHDVYHAYAQLGDTKISMSGIKGYMQLGTRRVESRSGGYVGKCHIVEDSFDRMYCDTYKRGSDIPCEKNVPINKQYPEN